MNRAKLNLLACPALGIYVATNPTHAALVGQPTETVESTCNMLSSSKKLLNLQCWNPLTKRKCCQNAMVAFAPVNLHAEFTDEESNAAIELWLRLSSCLNAVRQLQGKPLL